jgi:hypothetical protein
MRIVSLAALAALAVLPASVFAQSATPSAPSGPSTSAPATKPDITPEMKARFEKFRAACGTDLQTHCKDIARGSEQGRSELRQCIDTHKAKFSATCQSAIVERDAARDARKSAPTDKPKT